MKNIITVAVALAILLAFPSINWAQEEDDPDPVAPETIEATTSYEIDQNQIEKTQEIQRIEGDYDQIQKTQEYQKIEGAYDQIEKTQEYQKIEAVQNQAVAIDSAILKIDACKVQGINVVGKEQVDVESSCAPSGVAAFRMVLSDKNNDGVVDSYNDGAGSIEFKAVDVQKKTAVGEQYDFAMQRFAQTLQAVAIARNGKSFGASEKCNKFTTEQGIEYEVFAKVGLSDKKQPIILGYKIKQTKDGDTITVDVSTDSLYKTAFAGIVPAVHASGCPLSEWVIFPDGIKSN